MSLVSVFWDMLRIQQNIKRTKFPLLSIISLLSPKWLRQRRHAGTCSSYCRATQPRLAAACSFAFLENRLISCIKLYYAVEFRRSSIRYIQAIGKILTYRIYNLMLRRFCLASERSQFRFSISWIFFSLICLQIIDRFSC